MRCSSFPGGGDWKGVVVVVVVVDHAPLEAEKVDHTHLAAESKEAKLKEEKIDSRSSKSRNSLSS